jgi:excinuclease UvrABC ATPase subunit
LSGYLELGQPLSTLSGGECQRIKLASELHKKGNIYVMDEPTTGLHMADIEKLMTIIEKLVDAGNTVLVIEHNLDVVKRADWVIDLGPGGGRHGGEILFEGTPEALTTCDRSYTGVYLKEVLSLVQTVD